MELIRKREWMDDRGFIGGLVRVSQHQTVCGDQYGSPCIEYTLTSLSIGDAEQFAKSMLEAVAVGRDWDKDTGKEINHDHEE